MKKILAMILSVTMALSLVACGSSAGSGSSDQTDTTAVSAGAESTKADTTSAADTESSAATSASDSSEKGTSGNPEDVDLSKLNAADVAGMHIGMTCYSLQNEFTVRMQNAAQALADKYGFTIDIYDGNYDAATQLEQVETMIQNGCDAIVLNPQDADACAACVEEANKSGIPVVGVNTMVSSDLLTSYVGSIDVDAGETIMQYMIDHMGNDNFNMVIIEGPMGQSAQLQRYEGITNVLDDHPNIKVLATDTANWSRSESLTLMEDWIASFGEDIDAVVAENDEMVLGAREALDAANMNDVPCIGIDGISDAVTAVQDGKMIASDFQNAEAQATTAVSAAIYAALGNQISDDYWIDFELITPENAADYVNKY